LANLCVNARDAIAGVGKLTIETHSVIVDDAYCTDHPGFVAREYVLLAVSDNGCGIDQVTLSKIFEPFFTTKEMGKGTGLGLATVYGIVKQNQEFINVYSESGHGTTFKIYLPRHATETEQMQEESPAAPAVWGHETILLVEDAPAMLDIARLMLEGFGYRVLAASTPGEAISVAKEYADEIHLLITDVVMPEMNGRDLAKDLISLYPGLRCLFMSGYTDSVIAHHGLLDEGFNFIQKPFSMQALAAKVREALGST
jgi:CheY-like chemotaxis protein